MTICPLQRNRLEMFYEDGPRSFEDAMKRFMLDHRGERAGHWHVVSKTFEVSIKEMLGNELRDSHIVLRDSRDRKIGA